MASTAASSVSAVGAALDPDFEAEIEDARARARRRLGGRRLAASSVLGGAFLTAAVLLAVLLPTERSASAATIGLLIVAYALALRVEFEVGPGVAMTSQLVFVPMLFVLPLRVVPLCVAAAFALRDAPELIRRRATVDYQLLRLAHCWYAIGPVAVLALAGEHAPRLGDWPFYVAALAAQFLLDFGASALWARLAVGESPREVARFVGWAWLVDIALAPVGLVVAAVAERSAAAVLLALPLIGLLAFFARERKTRIDHALELGQAYRGTALLLGDVVEADDAYTGKHSRDVVQLVLDVSAELGLSVRERRDAEFTALLHDVGKIRIPSEIINKAGPLTAEERAIINTHTIEGERLLAQVGGLLGQVGRIVRSCHERWDGGGYPDGLAGDEIPLIARIVCVCDAYSAITSDRPYRKALPPETGLAELRNGSGMQFDPQVVAAFDRVL